MKTVAKILLLITGIATLIGLIGQSGLNALPTVRPALLAAPAGYLYYHHDRCGQARVDLGCCGGASRPQGYDNLTPAFDGPVQPAAVGRLVAAFSPASRSRLMREFGLKRLHHIPQLGIEVLATRRGADVPTVIERLNREPGVLFAEPDYLAQVSHDKHKKRKGAAFLKRILKSLDPIHRAQPALDDIQAREAWKKYCTGCSAVKIAVVDTGVDPFHEDLKSVLLPGWDFVNDDNVPEDNLGHGTAMAGIIGAPGDNKVGIAGLCWNTRILPVKVADSQGQATFSNLARGIIWAAEQGARVINVSLGGRADSQLLRRACQLAARQGALIVSPAGNDNHSVLAVPARYPEVLAVASTNADDIGLVTNLSHRVDVAASGENIVSSVPGSLYSILSGTSCASAHIAGVASLILSHRPELNAAQVRAILRRAVDPIPALISQQGFYDFGRINVLKALEEAEKSTPDAGIRSVALLPRKPQPGQAATLLVELANRGNVAYLPGRLTLTIGQQTVEAQTPRLSVGQRQEIRVAFVTPAETVELKLSLSVGSGETQTKDNATTIRVVPTAEATHDLAIISARIDKLPLESGQVPIDVVIENRGNQPIMNSIISAHDRSSKALLATTAGLPLKVGGRRSARLWIPVNDRKGRALGVLLRASPSDRDATPRNNEGLLLVPLALHQGAELYYQQAGGIDILPDAPHRVQIDRGYLPIQVFVPYQGGEGDDRYLQIKRTTISMRDTPTGSGRTIYEDKPDAPPLITVEGLTLVDEMGRPVDGAADLFGGEARLHNRGRHQIFRIPLKALGISADETRIVEKYFEVKLEWDHMRRMFYFFEADRSGTVSWVLKVRFTPHAFPRLPGMAQHYYDAHHHTIAEWFIGDKFNLFAPKKAYGGPIQMIRESAYVMGLIDSREQMKHRVITTDHNVFFMNELTPGKPTTDPTYRPTFGPTAPQNSRDEHGKLKSEWQRYVDLFGLSAGEEVAISQGQALGIVPLGAHLLTYMGQHFDGPWHGGSGFSEAIGEGEKLELDTVLHTLAKKNPERNRHAFAYAAHPFSGQGWNKKHLDMALGLREQYRNERYVNTVTRQFVFKGLQLWNGKGERTLPSKAIGDFQSLNPWANSKFVAGNKRWDTALWETLDKYNQFITKNLIWSFNDRPSQKFIRKIYGEAGTDAHGDFNFSSARAATIISFSSTFSLDSNAWGKVRTLAFADEMPGATPEERLMQAMAAGNTVMTDGPIVHFTVDADTKFDSRTRTYHDRVEKHENDNGRLGGSGAFGGGRTALVIRSSPYMAFRYRYFNTPEFGTDGGKIKHIKIYRNTAAKPNPTRKIKIPGAGFFSAKSFDRLVSVGSLAPGGSGKELAEPINLEQEGAVDTPSAFYLGAFTGADPDTDDLAPDDARCYTNPIWVIPVDVRASLKQAGGAIPAKGLKIAFHFPLSITPDDYRIAVKVLGADGRTTDISDAPLVFLESQGWSSENKTASARYTLTNKKAIPLARLQRYPDNKTVSLLIYFHDIPKDINGNLLNAIAFKLPIEVKLGDGDALGGAHENDGTGGNADGAGNSGATPGDPNTEGAGGLKNVDGAKSGTGPGTGTGTAGSTGPGTGQSGNKGTGRGVSGGAPRSGSGNAGSGTRPTTGARGGSNAGGRNADGTGGSSRDGSGTDNSGIDGRNDPQNESDQRYRDPVVIERDASDRPEWRARPMVPIRSARRGVSGRRGRPRNSRSGGKRGGLAVEDRGFGSENDGSVATTPSAPADDDPLAKIGCFLATASLEQVRGPQPASATTVTTVTNWTGSYKLSDGRLAELNRLRRFRNRVLLRWEPGQAFVRNYYTHSPALARSIRHRPAARTAVRWLVIRPAVIGAGVALGEDRRPAYLLLGFLGLLLLGLRRRRRLSRC